MSAYWRIGTRGAVGSRSCATGIARLETSLCLFTFYQLATPVARERNPTAPTAREAFAFELADKRNLTVVTNALGIPASRVFAS